MSEEVLLEKESKGTPGGALVEVKPMWPVKVMRSVSRGIRSAMGQLATQLFWTKLGKLIVTEMINAFMKTLGAKFVTFGASREDQDVKKMINTVVQGGGSSAFSSPSYTPTRAEPAYQRPAYEQPAYQRPDYRNYPVPVTPPPVAADFPGFIR